jgi:hypothetical protein
MPHAMKFAVTMGSRGKMGGKHPKIDRGIHQPDDGKAIA